MKSNPKSIRRKGNKITGSKRERIMTSSPNNRYLLN